MQLTDIIKYLLARLGEPSSQAGFGLIFLGLSKLMANTGDAEGWGALAAGVAAVLRAEQGSAKAGK